MENIIIILIVFIIALKMVGGSNHTDMYEEHADSILRNKDK